MFLEDWITTDLKSLWGTALSTAVVYIGIIVYCRLAGLRSFSKMSASDFAMTVAVGSLFAATVSSPDPTLLLGLFALAGLYFFQWLISLLRKRKQWASKFCDNKPVLLMRGEEILEDNMRKSLVTKSDLMAKLREANVLNFNEVRAVVFESTGDVSVLHSATDDETEVADEILEGVVGWKVGN